MLNVITKNVSIKKVNLLEDHVDFYVSLLIIISPIDAFLQSSYANIACFCLMFVNKM